MVNMFLRSAWSVVPVVTKTRPEPLAVSHHASRARSREKAQLTRSPRLPPPSPSGPFSHASFIPLSSLRITLLSSLFAPSCSNSPAPPWRPPSELRRLVLLLLQTALSFRDRRLLIGLAIGILRPVQAGAAAEEKPLRSRVPFRQTPQVGKVHPRPLFQSQADRVVQYGVGMPKGEVARSGEEAESVAKSIGIFRHSTRPGTRH